MINETTLEVAKATAHDTSLLIVWASVLVLFWFVTWAFKSKKMSWGHFWANFGIVAIISGVFTFFIAHNPTMVVTLTTKFKELLGI